MPSAEGSIRSINVFDNFCCVSLLKTDNTLQTLLLWSYGDYYGAMARLSRTTQRIGYYTECFFRWPATRFCTIAL